MARNRNRRFNSNLSDSKDTQMSKTETESQEVDGSNENESKEAPSSSKKLTLEPKKEDTKNQQEAPVKAEKGSEGVYKIEVDLLGYMEAMDKSKAVVPEEGGRWQYSLFVIIKNAMDASSQEEFNAGYNTVLSFFNKNKDNIFNERYIFRFPEYWPGSEKEFVQFRRLVYLILQTADPKTRKKGLENVNLELAAEGLNENTKNMLFNFYLL